MGPSGPLPPDINSAVPLLVLAAVAAAAAAAAVVCVEDAAGLIADDGVTNAWQPARDSVRGGESSRRTGFGSVSVAGRFSAAGRGNAAERAHSSVNVRWRLSYCCARKGPELRLRLSP